MNERAEKRNVLITGGAGFIGSHLCEALLKTSRVICLDNFITGREENINQLLANPDFKFLRIDITKPVDLTAFPELRPFRLIVEGVAAVYHCASPSAPADIKRFPLETLLANALGTNQALELAAAYKASFILLSSSAVYGSQDGLASVGEDAYTGFSPIDEGTAYAEGKRFAEALTMRYGVVKGLSVRVVRLFETYGPRMRVGDGRLVPTLIVDALAGRPLKLPLAKSAATSLVYVSDCIEAILKVAEGTETGPFNIGNPEPLTLGAIADRIIALTESTSMVSEGTSSQTEALPSIAFVKERIGWFPIVGHEVGLAKTVEAVQAGQVMGMPMKDAS